VIASFPTAPRLKKATVHRRGFSAAFDATGMSWAGYIVSVGELCTLPVVALLGAIAQPRLQYAIAKDGLLPRIFAEVDEKGNLVRVPRCVLAEGLESSF